MLWENALEGYWLEKRRNVSPATIQDYSGTYRRFREFLGADQVHFEKVTTDQARKFLAKLHEGGAAPKSVANAWIALSSLWTWAEKELEVPHIIRGRVTMPKYRRPAIEPYSKMEVRAMLDAATKNAPWISKHGRKVEEGRDTGWRDRAILLTLLDTGLRASELCALCVQDYDQKSGKAHVRKGKGAQEPLRLVRRNGAQGGLALPGRARHGAAGRSTLCHPHQFAHGAQCPAPHDPALRQPRPGWRKPRPIAFGIRLPSTTCATTARCWNCRNSWGMSAWRRSVSMRIWRWLTWKTGSGAPVRQTTGSCRGAISKPTQPGRIAIGVNTPVRCVPPPGRGMR